MSDNPSSNDMTRIGNTVRRAYANETLSPDQHRRHRVRMSEARIRTDSRGANLLRPRRMELVVVATMLVLALATAVVWQSLPGTGSGEANPPTMPLGSGMPDTTQLESGVSINQMRSMAADPAPGTGYSYTVSFTSDVRLDQSAMTTWEAEIRDRTLEDGTRQQRVIVHDQSGAVIADYVRNGDRWYWYNRGWTESGQMQEIIDLPPEIAMVLAEPANIIDLLGDEVGGYPLEQFPDLLSLQYAPTLFPDVDRIAAVYGLAEYQYVAEVVFNTMPGYVPGEYISSSERVLIESGAPTEDALRLSLGRFSYHSHPQLGTDSFSDEHFAIPEIPVQRYSGPASDALPFGLEVIDRYLITPEGGERMLLAGEDIQVEVLILPSLGGLDNPAWQAIAVANQSDTVTFSASETDGFEVLWLTEQADASIVAATWDDGRYHFRTIAIPLTWSELELVELAEALSTP